MNDKTLYARWHGPRGYQTPTIETGTTNELWRIEPKSIEGGARLHEAVEAITQREQLLAENERLRSALRAIIARVTGTFDDPDLLPYGPLMSTTVDVPHIARTALRKED